MRPPELDVPALNSSKWEEEQRAFLELRPTLLQSHAGKHVAVHDGKVVDFDEDRIALALRAYAKFGYMPIYIGSVSGSARPTVRLPGPREASSSALL
jgi:hypothetical protein